MNLRHQAALRFYLRHPWQLVLAIAGIALGVAVVVAVDLAGGSALRAFELSQALTSNRASHRIESVSGDLPEHIYRLVKVELGIDLAAPIVEGRVAIQDIADLSVSLMGLDPLAELAFDDEFRLARSAASGAPLDGTALIIQPGAVLLPQVLAARLGVANGDPLVVNVRGGRHRLRVAGVIPLNEVAGESGPLIADITTAQEVLDVTGSLTRIELALSEDQAERVAGALPAGITLSSAASSDNVSREMLRAFRINLTALSLLALVVGMLLIYATMSFAIVQRRESLGTLRALGVTRGEVTRDVLTESVVLGVIATGFGLLLGLVLSGSLIDLVLTTINDLYFSARVRPAGLPLAPIGKAGLLGIGATTLAALHPAMEAAREPPRAAITRVAYERISRRRFSAGPWIALGCLGVGSVLILLPGGGLMVAFIGQFLVLAAYALLIPAATAWLLRRLDWAAGRFSGLWVRLALRGAVASLGRTGIAVTALAVAVAHVVGIGVMIDSFRGSVAQWLEGSLLADYYLVTGSGAGGFTAAEIAGLQALTDVAGVSLSRTTTLKTAAGEVAIRAAAAGPRGYGEELISGDPERAFEALAAGDTILLTESYASRNTLSVGDTLSLPSPKGDMDFLVSGVFRDYRTGGSAALLPYAVFSDIWGYRPPHGLGIYVKDGGDADRLSNALGAFATQRGDTGVVANAALRRSTLEVFDRTFRVTGVLRLLAGIVAFFGILSALLALQLERSREVATLRAIGFTRAQVGGNALAQTTLLGLITGLLALPLGLVLAALLIYVINQRSFGWSMGFVIQPGQLVTGIGLALLAAFLAGLYPARRLAAQPIAASLRSE